MAAAVVQFRQDEADLAYLKGRGLNPNEFGREAFQSALKILRAQENVKQINAMRERIRKRIGDRRFFEGEVVDLVRKDRDAP